MPRINVEDKLFLDERFIELAEDVGRFQAVGMLVCFWRLAQQYWVKEELIPAEVFNRRYKILEKYGFAERREQGFYCSGSEQQFAWVVKQHKNGQKGGRPNKNKDLQKPKQNPSETLENPLYSLLFTHKDSPKGESRTSPKTAKTDPLPFSVQKLIKCWNENKHPDMPICRAAKTGTARYKSAAARIKEHPDLEFWSDAIGRMAKSDFLAGKNDRGWRADFDFLIKSQSIIKVLEGKYDNKEKPQDIVYGVNQNAGQKPPEFFMTEEEREREREYERTKANSKSSDTQSSFDAKDLISKLRREVLR